MTMLAPLAIFAPLLTLAPAFCDEGSAPGAWWGRVPAALIVVGDAATSSTVTPLIA